MWAQFAESALKLLAAIFSGFISYQAGKKSVESNIKDNTIKDANRRKEIDLEIAKTYTDPVARKRLLDKWHE